MASSRAPTTYRASCRSGNTEDVSVILRLQIKAKNSIKRCIITSTCICKFGPAEEAQVAGTRPHRLRISEAQARVEVIGLQGLVSIHREVTAAIMGTVNPDLVTQNRPGTREVVNSHR